MDAIEYCDGKPDPWGICECGTCQPTPAVRYALLYGAVDLSWSTDYAHDYMVRHPDHVTAHEHSRNWTRAAQCTICSGTIHDIASAAKNGDRSLPTLNCDRWFLDDSEGADLPSAATFEPCRYCRSHVAALCPCTCHEADPADGFVH